MNRLFTYNQKFSIRIPIFITIIILPIISLFILSSAGNYESRIFGFLLNRVEKQMLWFFLGLNIFIMMQFIRLRILNEKINFLYILLIALILLPYLNDATKGAQNWFLGFQPSELGKIIIVAAFAKFLSDRKDQINNLVYIFTSLIIILIPVFVFISQKDIGTALVYCSIICPMLYWIGLKNSILFLLISPIIISYISITFGVYEFHAEQPVIIKTFYFPNLLLFSWLLINFLFILKKLLDKKLFIINKFFIILSIILINISFSLISNNFWNYLAKDKLLEEKSEYAYVTRRIENFIIPSLNPRGGGYQVAQSIVAVGSGGIFGKGLGQGTQINMNFLPEADTDFIIASIGETFGFFIIILIIIIYCNLFYWLLIYSENTRNNFLSLLIIGYLSILFFHVFITIGMAVGLTPVTGLPAPFLSYGGTFTLSTYIMLGICNNISNNNI